ncbi:CIC_collapsed_G0038870.mRNA.1.CDS.1 [Saccharomyces cerevisiae]|nr:BBT_HP_G0005960.mRNA.1.CDS.1 [Saccharomyces cerevisiae]CAI5200735.1 BBT_HP_G0165080.mRNA.1.CDS.1 [Saccharomyces cerevisiae]CAI5201716.1 BBT_HP_G0166350.mRNA.1.CDS.1 [Saccharomyces cerevisiae]CAI6615048.1 CIC_HP1_G0034810.mRNA.1.CDS.1 [Saccharomyces cerevisiae]CAI6961603.1 BBT_HP_G0005960.mRNA.1.CDS.1 [Saccharomyces cerevisiae]
MGRPRKNVSQEKIQQLKRELELAGNRTDVLLQDKKGRSRSCLLCRRRKQRCDHKLPSCTACLKAGIKCVQPSKYSSSTSNSNTNNNTPTAGTVPPTPHPVIKRELQDSSIGAGAGAATSLNDMTIIKPISTSNSNVDAGDANEFRKTIKSVTTNSNPNLMRHDKDQYTIFLEKKLKSLETLLDLSPGCNQYNYELSQYKKVSHLFSNNTSDYSRPNSSNMVILPLPSPSNKPLENTNNNGSNVNAATNDTSASTNNINNNNAICQSASLLNDPLETLDFTKCIFAKYNLKKEFLMYDPIFELNEKLSRSFLDTFFTRLQFKYPILDEQEIYTFYDHYLHNKILIPPSSPATSSAAPPSNSHSYSEIEFHFLSGRMWLVFSISAYLLMTTGKYKGFPPHRYFSTAIRHITKCGLHLNYVQQIELLTLLVLYIIRTDRDSLILYDIIKDVMGISKKKLHLNQWYPNDPFANKKLRLFWCVYLLERMICVAVGKPYTIKESEINLPLFNNDSFYTKGVHAAAPSTNDHGVQFINQSLKLRRIESQFVETLQLLKNDSRSVKQSIDQLPLVRKFFEDLVVWRKSYSTLDVKNFENETLKLYYYRSVRLLIQPYLEFFAPEDRLFRECQAAAGQICQLYKIFHQKTLNGHSTPAVHTVFVAGVTLIYCMWLARNFDDQRRKKLGDASKHTRPLISASLFSTMDDLRACSVCLYVMTERSNFARTFRDTFDQLMNATVGNLIERCGPDSSELIFMASSVAKRTEPKNINDEANKAISSGGTLHDSNSANAANLSNSNDKNISHNGGMPPAVARIFGKGQAEEHAGFVENSQVDLAEQEKFKKKQGVLEKTSVPKKFDWQVFQQQAFLQQQLAQHNLQAYLSSLNTDTMTNRSPSKSSSISTASSHSDPIPIAMTQSPTPYPQTSNMLPQQHVSRPLPQQQREQPQQHITSPQRFSESNFTNQLNNGMINSNPLQSAIFSNHTSENKQLRDVEESNFSTSPLRADYGNNIISSIPASFTSNSIPVSVKQARNGSSSGDILFSNGAHDMINNISTWTNNSVLDALNSKSILQTIFPQSQEPSSLSMDKQQQQHQQQNMCSENNVTANNFQQTQNDPSYNRNLFMMSNQEGVQYNLDETEKNGPKTQVEANTSANLHFDNVIPTVTNADIRKKRSNWDNMMTSGPVEDFWTINDDYGFLT